MATIRDVVASVTTMPDDQTLYAERPWSPDSNAATDGDDRAPDGLDYLIEVDLAREVLQVWSAWRGGSQPSVDEAAAAVIYYATFDTYQPIEHDG